MKVTAVLFRKNMLRFIKFQWHAHGNIKVYPTTAEEILKSHGHEVVDIKDVLHPPKKMEKVEVVGLYDRVLPKDKNHPDYKAEPCFKYGDNNVLLEGLQQAKVLTNTVEISQGLPELIVENENKLNLPDEIHSEVKKKIMLSCVFEATQNVLPKRKDPLKPAWRFPRDYGIDEKRKNELLCKNLVTICEQFLTNIRNKSLISDAFFSLPLEIHNKKIQLEITSELVLTTGKKLRPLGEPSSTCAVSLPNLYPVDCTVSLIPHNFYEMKNIYPPNVKSKWPYIQTAILHFCPTEVKNIFEESVTLSQFQGRSLLKGFTIAAAEARALFGNDVKELPEPVVVPVVQTDGKLFHFAIFQLNTMNLDTKSEIKNIFWNSPEIPLYGTCEYISGKPVLEDYNPEIIRRLITFCNIE